MMWLIKRKKKLLIKNEQKKILTFATEFEDIYTAILYCLFFPPRIQTAAFLASFEKTPFLETNPKKKV